jgi:protein involved in sex pheromone biosynthesis
MCDCCRHESDSGKSTSFVFGLVLGAIIGAIIAVIIYKNNKNEVVASLKEKLEEYFRKFMGSVEKTKKNISKKPKTVKKPIPIVIAPAKPETPKITYVTARTRKSPPKMFVKSKR